MIIGLYVSFFIIALIMFGLAFYTHQEILWVLCMVLFGLLMFTSYNIEVPTYIYNSTLGAYQQGYDIKSYGYMMGVNMVFFSLATILFFYDIWNKYMVKDKA